MPAQDDINDAEWSRAENWRTRWGVVTVYSSPRDTRLYVPKQNPRYGQTLNFAHSQARWSMGGLFSVPIGFAILGVLLWVARLLRSL